MQGVGAGRSDPGAHSTGRAAGQDLVNSNRGQRAMRIARRFTVEGQDPYQDIAFTLTTSEIRNPDGSVVFRLADMEVPQDFSQVASDILAQKYFRKAGIPAALKPVAEKGMPTWLRRHVPDDKKLATLPEKERFGPEHSAK